MAKRIVSNINDFPDEILSHILSFLPTKEAARTSILSTRWRDQFVLLSNLDLELSKDSDDEEYVRFIRFVDRHVLYRDIPTIQRFRILCQKLIDPQRLAIWLWSLVRHQIQELDFFAYFPSINDSSLAQTLFGCESLEILTLNLGLIPYELKVPDRIFLPRLKVLRLELIEFPNDGSEERLFSSCPALEELVLHQCLSSQGCVKFSISNQNLKHLKLDIIGIIGEPTVAILINAPSLLLVDYYITKDYSLVFMDAKTPAKVIVNVILGKYLNDCHGDDDEANPEYVDVRDRYVVDALKRIQNINTLKASYHLLSDLQEYNVPIPFFNKMTWLEINDLQLWGIGVENFLARCVVLETLVFEPYYYQSFPYIGNQYSLQKSRLAPLLCQLKTIKFKLYNMAHAEAFVEIIAFFLENAMVLEEVKIQSAQISHPSQQVEIVRKLMSFPRASSKCKVEAYNRRLCKAGFG